MKVHLQVAADPLPSHRDIFALCLAIVRNAEAQELEPAMGQKLELQLANLCSQCRKEFLALPARKRKYLYALIEGERYVEQ